MGSFSKPNEPHVVCFHILLARGHRTPMLKLARLIHHKGFHTIIVKSWGHSSLDGMPDFQFEAIPDGLSLWLMLMPVRFSVTLSQAPHFVSFLLDSTAVNFGNITVMTQQQLVEFAWGLAISKKTFLWIGPDLVRGIYDFSTWVSWRV